MIQIFRYKVLLLLTFLLLLKSATIYGTTERNILTVYINSNNELLVEGNIVKIDSLKDIVKSFILNPNNEADKCEKKEKSIKYFGTVQVPVGVISIQCERNTIYGFFIQVQNEIEEAFNEIWNELSINKFKKEYKFISKRQRKAINEYIPKIISEAEPQYIWKDGKLVKNVDF